MLNETDALLPTDIVSGLHLQAKIDGKIKNGTVHKVIRESSTDVEDNEPIVKIDVKFSDGSRKIMNPFEVGFYW